MGCDIHSFAEKRNNQTGRWEILDDIFPLSESYKIYYGKDFSNEPFAWRNYDMFRFLANVRNHYNYECISLPKGFPNDSNYLNGLCDDEYRMGDTIKEDILNRDENHSYSYLTVSELASYDYERFFLLNRRMDDHTKKEISYRILLGKDFFRDLDILRQQGDPNDVRIVFWFDN